MVDEGLVASEASRNNMWLTEALPLEKATGTTCAAEASGGKGHLLSLKTCMSHQVHKGQRSMRGRYIMQQASRSGGRRC